MKYDYSSTIPFLELLSLIDKNFDKDINQIRKKYSIKIQESYDVERYIEFDNRLWIDDSFRESYYSDVQKILSDYHLEDYLDDVQVYIETNDYPYSILNDGTIVEAFTAKIRGLEIKPYRKYSDYLPQQGVVISFRVRSPIIKTDVFSFIESKIETIVVTANDYFTGNKRAILKAEKAGRALEIFKIKSNNKKLTDSGIADELYNRLTKVYPDHPDLVQAKINEQSIKQLRLYYQKKYNSKKLKS